MDQREKDAIIRVLESRWWGLGPETAKFEEEFLQYLGEGVGVATNSGTAALHMALWNANISYGDEVIVPSFTFVSSAHAVKYLGGKPVFADIEPENLTIDPESIESKITERTKAIMPVHYGGQSCKMDEIMKIARDNNILVLEDCAHAAGAEYKGKKLGTIGHMAAFSFHAVKNIATGDAGMLIVKDPRTLERMKSFRWVGITKTTWDRYAPDTKPKEDSRSTYDVEDLGYKYHMNDIQAALARVQLERLDRVNNIRKELVKRYKENLSNLKDVNVLNEHSWAKSSNHLFVILSKKRDKIMKHLNLNGVATSIHYSPVHKFSLYGEEYKDVKLPITEKITEEVLTLPLFPDLNPEEIDFICYKIKEVVS